MRRPVQPLVVLLLTLTLAPACATLSGQGGRSMSGAQVAGIVGGIGTMLVAGASIYTCVQYDQCDGYGYEEPYYEEDYADDSLVRAAVVEQAGVLTSPTIPLPAPRGMREGPPPPTLELGPTGMCLRF